VNVPHIQIIIGSTREQRRSAGIAAWLRIVACEREDLSFELVDLAEWELPFLSAAVPPVIGDYAEQRTREWADQIATADGYVLVTGEYNHGYPAPLKNALDLLFAEWNRKPVAFVSYGGAAGGTRAVEQLRQVAIELEMVPIRRQVAIPRIWEALSAEGHPDELHARDATRMLDDLAWWAQTLRSGRLAAAAVEV
jgi:NAD(P)H-dependent FMN reductase